MVKKSPIRRPWSSKGGLIGNTEKVPTSAEVLSPFFHGDKKKSRIFLHDTKMRFLKGKIMSNVLNINFDPNLHTYHMQASHSGPNFRQYLFSRP